MRKNSRGQPHHAPFFIYLGGIGLCRCYGRVKTENKRAKVGGVMKVRADPPPPTYVLTKLLNGLTRPKSRTPQRLLQSRWVAASHGATCVWIGWKGWSKGRFRTQKEAHSPPHTAPGTVPTTPPELRQHAHTPNPPTLTTFARMLAKGSRMLAKGSTQQQSAVTGSELWNSRCGIFCRKWVKQWPIGCVRSGDLSATGSLFTTVAGGGDSVGQLI